MGGKRYFLPDMFSETCNSTVLLINLFQTENFAFWGAHRWKFNPLKFLRPPHLRMSRNNKKSSVRPFLLRNWVPTSCARPLNFSFKRLYFQNGTVKFFILSTFDKHD